MLAIMDTRPRLSFSEEETASLADLAGVVMHQLNMVRNSPHRAPRTPWEAKFHALMSRPHRQLSR